MTQYHIDKRGRKHPYKETSCNDCKKIVLRLRPNRKTWCEVCIKEQKRKVAKNNRKDYYAKNRKTLIANVRRWQKKNPENVKLNIVKNAKRLKERRIKAREEALQHYGNKCNCCGESEKEFLTIDHIDGGGNKHKKTTWKIRAYSIYIWLVDNNFPEGFQLLCMNCNFGKGSGKKCPHQR